MQDGPLIVVVGDLEYENGCTLMVIFYFNYGMVYLFGRPVSTDNIFLEKDWILYFNSSETFLWTQDMSWLI